MFESRCGVLCNSCEKKEAGICKGCPAMEKPFWGGECKVKSCCEEQNFNHCGECSQFPCEVLSHMGEDQGYNPQIKIDTIKKWIQDK